MNVQLVCFTWFDNGNIYSTFNLHKIAICNNFESEKEVTRDYNKVMKQVK